MGDILKNLGSTVLAGTERAEYDFYSTDPQAVNDLLAKMPELGKRGLKVLEPCAGIGTIADRYTTITKNEVDMYDIVQRRDDIICSDYMDVDAFGKYDLIITNFPYKNATKANPIGFNQLLNKALNDVKPGGYVASFQKLLQLESKKRYEEIYGRRKPEIIFVYSHRMKCFKNGDTSQIANSAVAYSWAVWHKDMDGFFSKDTKLDWIY